MYGDISYNASEIKNSIITGERRGNYLVSIDIDNIFVNTGRVTFSSMIKHKECLFIGRLEK